MHTPPLKDLVADRLRRAILLGQIKPGERLVETTLAGAMGVSRGPIREAIKELEQVGLVTHYPRRGAVVSTLDPRDAWEIYSLRATLERQALLFPAVRVGPEVIARLEALVAKMGAITDAELQGAVELDLAFHAAVCDCSPNRRLYQVFRSLDGLVAAMFLTVTTRLGLRPSEMESKHRPILEALAAGDLAGAAERIERHYLDTADRLLKLGDAGEAPTRADPSG